MKRTLILALAALLLTGGVAAQAVTVAPTVTDYQGSFGSYETPEDTITHAPTNNPTWVVTTSDAGALESWIDDSESRRLLRNQSDGRAVIAASPTDIGTTRLQAVFNAGLSRQGYIERVAPNRALSLTEPVATSAIPTAENFTYPEGFRGEGLLSSSADYPTSGIAHRDSTAVTTVADARAVIGADNVTETGAGLTVAVVDSGLNTANGSLGLASRVDGASKDFVDSTDSSEETVATDGIDAVSDPNGHGTWVTSALAADPDTGVSDETYEGVAPDATILSMRVLDEDGSGSTGDIAAAIRRSERNGADVIAMSLGSQVYTAEIAAAISDACAGNTTAVTVATGNSRRLGSPYLASPSDVPADCVVSVAASNTTAPANAGVASFSQLGPDTAADLSNGATLGESVDVAAPGMRVQAKIATTDGSLRNETLSGTSMAQPFVAGATLQALEGQSALVNDSAALSERLRTTARAMPNAASAEAGHGMVAADRAIADNTTGESQSEAMDNAAQTRDEFWRGGGATKAVERVLNDVRGVFAAVGL